MNMNKLRKKHNQYRCLKTISYLLGFPLFIVLVLVGSMCLFAGEAFTDIKWHGVLACVILWVISIVAQIIISLITKNYTTRTAFMLIVSVVLVLGGAVICDTVVAAKYNKIIAEYEQYGVELNSYKYDAGWVDAWTPGKDSVVKQYANDVADFTRIYNIEYKSQNYGDYNGNSTDDVAAYRAKNGGSKEGMTDEDYVLSRITYDKKADAYYSVNGLYADGYIFGYKQALEVLINYNQSKFNIENTKKVTTDADGNEKVTYTPNGKDADDVLAEEMIKVGKSSAWNSYKKTAEYKEAKDRTIKNIDRLLKSLGSGLMETSIMSIVSGVVDLDSLLAMVNLTQDDLKNLSVSMLCNILNGLLFPTDAEEGGELSATIASLLSGFGIDTSKNIDDDVIFEVYSEQLYQYPTLKPKFSFIEDDDIRTYAEAKYYATVHGRNVGSVLVGTKKVTTDEKGKKTVTYGPVGETLMSGGKAYPSETFAYSLTELYSLKAREELAQYYPYMIARKFGYIFVGVIALMTVLFYMNKKKEDEVFEIIAGGRR